MILVLKKEQYSINNIYLNEPIKNNIINNGSFIKIIYSTQLFTINGIYLLLNFEENTIEIYNNNNNSNNNSNNNNNNNNNNKQKMYYSFNLNNNINKDIINYIKQLEINILQLVNTNKIPQYKIYDNITQSFIKLYLNNNYNNKNIILKISGIWENETQYGLSYKFITYNNII